MDVNGMINVNPPITHRVSARKPHRKTRTGCRTCKQRKIKCDEQRPSCNNCIKHSVSCDFMSPDSAGSTMHRASISHDSPPNIGPFVATSLLNFNSSPNQDHTLVDSSSLNLVDLHLLHNYTTGTADTLHTDGALRILFRQNVPQAGFKYDFVMHGILALSAQHLAHYNPSKRHYYTELASRHHQAGLRSMNSVLRNINAGNCDAMYIFSTLMVYYNFAGPRKPGDFLLVGEHGLEEWIFLVRDTNSIINSFQETLKAGPFGALFVSMQRALHREKLKDNAADRDPLYALESVIQNNCINRDHVPILMDAIKLLGKSVTYTYIPGVPGSEIEDIFIWMFRMSNEYLELLKHNRQESLCVFAYFCVVLRRLENHWWMEGWSAFLMERIWSLLDSEHRLWVRWPIEEIGWIPGQ